MSTNGKEFEVVNEAAIVPIVPTPLTLLQQAITQGVSVEQLERLQLMHERWEANEAHKAFDEAMNKFKTNAPRITKNKRVEFGTGDRKTSYDHATLDHVCDQVIGELSKHGITHRWTMQQDKDWIKVTCILSKGIHREETSLAGAPDISGSKNSVQAIASTVTYLQRYTLLAATGLAAANTDNDGAGGAPRFVELAERLEWIENCSNLDELQKVFTAAYKQARAVNDQRAMKSLIDAKDKRRGELR